MNRYRVCLAALVAVLFVMPAAPSSAKEYYEWTDEMGVRHITDEFSKVPAEYRSRTTVKGAKVLAETVEQMNVMEGRASEGNRMVNLEDIAASFEIPDAYTTDKGTWKGEEFRELGHKTGERGERAYSNRSVDIQVITLPAMKATTLVSAVITGVEAARMYLKEHPGEDTDLIAFVKSARLLPVSGHVVFSFAPSGAGGKDPVEVQVFVGAYGLAWVRWTGPAAEQQKVRELVLSTWKNQGAPVALVPFKPDDLNHPIIQGAAAAVIILLAAITGLFIWLKKRRD